MKLIFALVTALSMLPVSATATVARAADAADAAAPAPASDVIARVGDQTITFSEINTALNSSAIVGISIPALGTQERDTVRITLLDKFISINLLYLDALKRGVDREPEYQKAISRFSNAVLAGLYRQRYMTGDISVTEEEVQAYFKDNVAPGATLDDSAHAQIEATLRRKKLQERMAASDKTLRKDVEIVVHDENLAIKGDEARADDTPLAEVGGEVITWGQVDDKIISAGKGATIADPLAFEDPARRAALEREIDLRIMAQKARVAGLESDPVYVKRVGEYRKTLLINLHRERLAQQMEPTDAELKAYYEANRTRFVLPEARKIQMVVVKTREEADQLKTKLDAGEITMYEAARDHSIAVNADQNLGEVGWVNQGEMAPELDKEIFMLNPGEVSSPVESPAGWHLVTVQELKEAKYTDLNDETTRRLTRRTYLHDEIDAYTADLRKNQFAVEVYEDRLVQLAQQEADMVKTLTEQAKEPGSVTQQRIEEMQEQMKKPAM